MTAPETRSSDIERQKLEESTKSNDINGDSRPTNPSDVIGSWGPFQRRIFIAVTLMYSISPFINNTFLFITPKDYDFYCVDDDPESGSPLRLKNSCFLNRTSDDSNTTLVKCTKFEYDNSFHERTLIGEFDLVCDRAWMASATESMHQFGFLVSGLTLGIVSDRYGRFFSAKLAIIIEIISHFGQAFSPTIYLYMTARFFVGFAAYGRFLNGYILLAEWVGPTIRAKVNILYEGGPKIVAIAVPLVMYYVPDYFKVQFWTSSVEVVLFLIYAFTVFESPKWLLTHGKYDAADRIITKAAVANRQYSSEEEIETRIQQLKWSVMQEKASYEMEKRSSLSVLTIIKDCRLLKNVLIICMTWVTCEFISFGSAMLKADIGGSLYWNTFTFSWTSWLSVGVRYYIIPRFQRRTIMNSSLIVMVVFILATFGCSFHDELLAGRIVFTVMFNIARGLAHYTLQIYTTETFPTTMRQSAMGMCVLFGRIGTTTAPFVRDLAKATHLSIPYAIFASLGIVNAILVSFLPDTKDIQLPDNILQTQKNAEGTVEKTEGNNNTEKRE